MEHPSGPSLRPVSEFLYRSRLGRLAVCGIQVERQYALKAKPANFSIANPGVQFDMPPHWPRLPVEPGYDGYADERPGHIADVLSTVACCCLPLALTGTAKFWLAQLAEAAKLC